MKRRHLLGASPLIALPRLASAQSPDCSFTPDFVEGPFYVKRELFRQNITEHLPGLPLWVELVLLDAASCAPLSQLPVDIWMASPRGEYSGVNNALLIAGGRNTEGQTFMRGTQLSNAQGVVRFQALFPGWYEVTPPHLHFSVRVARDQAFTSQFFFDDGFAAAIYNSAEHYRDRGEHPRKLGWPIPGGLVTTPRLQADGSLLLRRVIGIRQKDLAPTCGYGEPGCGAGGPVQWLRDLWRIVS